MAANGADRLGNRRGVAVPVAILCLILSSYVVWAEPPPTKVFNAVAAWNEFDELVRTRYGYLERPGVHGDAILRHFAPQAEASATQADFIDVLQLVAHNFADPHFIVGPLNDDDYAVFPTSADLFAQGRGQQFTIVDVRRDSDAQRQGVSPGSRIISIDGLTPTAAIERALGRPIQELSSQQKDAGINIALAGRRHHRRSLVIANTTGEQAFDLAPTNGFADAVAARPSVTFERRTSGAAVIRIENSLGNNETIKAFAAALDQAKGTNRLVIDLRNTPSGGNTTVARGILGHFIDREHPYQVHVVPAEQRQFGVPRKFVEYVLPIAPRYRGKVIVLGGHWTGSMGEGLMIGFEAIGVRTAGSRLAHLLGALFNEQLEVSGARVDLGEEQLFDVRGKPREDFVPDLHDEREEGHGSRDALLDRALRSLH
jgi:carboxyl-terminal processing protease